MYSLYRRFQTIQDKFLVIILIFIENNLYNIRNVLTTFLWLDDSNLIELIWEIKLLEHLIYQGT